MSIPNEAELIANLNHVVVNAALQDPAFRAALLADPKAVIEHAVNAPLPPGCTVKVVEASQSEFTIVLPYQGAAAANGELSDADLEAVAGGSKSGAVSFFKGTMGINDHSDAGSAGAGLAGHNDGSFYGQAGWAGGVAVSAGTSGRPPISLGQQLGRRL